MKAAAASTAVGDTSVKIAFKALSLLEVRPGVTVRLVRFFLEWFLCFCVLFCFVFFCFVLFCLFCLIFVIK